MAEERKDAKDLVLCLLARFHPIKASEKEVADELHAENGLNQEEVHTALESLRIAGSVEMTTVQLAHLSATEDRYSITDKGREALRAKGMDPAQECITPREIESRLISNYDRIKAEMEQVRQNLERNQKTLETEMTGIRKSMGEHDQFVRTYMVRIVESISMFIGIFAITVVMMVNVLKDLSLIPDKTMLVIFVATLPTLLIITIIPGLWLIRRMILEPRPH
ncbi:MAG: hypothetical protein A4E32_01548 [Methanomassiliicoccales archaeon PtaU1.Bin124]|nr:MAG: hypothetical protein A4E32_01548 [Methanomassiliicoccales archaeon PtaU1.Bin124]